MRPRLIGMKPWEILTIGGVSHLVVAAIIVLAILGCSRNIIDIRPGVIRSQPSLMLSAFHKYCHRWDRYPPAPNGHNDCWS